MIFQYFPRIRRDAYIENRFQELEKILSWGPLSIHDNQVAFFFFGRETGIMEKIWGVLAIYQGDSLGLILTAGWSPRF